MPSTQSPQEGRAQLGKPTTVVERGSFKDLRGSYEINRGGPALEHSRICQSLPPRTPFAPAIHNGKRVESAQPLCIPDSARHPRSPGVGALQPGQEEMEI